MKKKLLALLAAVVAALGAYDLTLSQKSYLMPIIEITQGRAAGIFGQDQITAPQEKAATKEAGLSSGQ